MNDPVLIRLIGGAVAYNLELGFIPKYAVVTIMSAGNPDTYRWFGEMMEDSAEALAGSWEYGIKNTAGGAETYMATTAAGISAYDGAKTPQVLLENPSTGDLEKTDVYGSYDATVDYDSVGTDRSATVIGTIIRPSSHNGYVYELKTKTGGAAGAEPTWGTTPGETTTDTIGNIWICREENVVANKGLGITLGGTLLENDKVVYVEAYRYLRCEDIGDIG